MATKSDLQTATIHWTNRVAQARAAGLPDRIWRPLMQRDFNAIYQGHSPMSDAEVLDAMRSAAGLSPITDPQKGTGPLDVIGNIKSDIQGIVTQFMPGVLNYVETLPQQAYDFLHMNTPEMQKKYGMETGDKWSAIFTDPAGVIRDLSREPLFGPLVPGLHTAAALTTSSGRKQLEQHPVSTVIDVGAALSALGKAGILGSGAEEAGAASRLDAVQAGNEPPPPTVMEALQKGEPYRALGRATLKGAEIVPGGNVTRTSIRNVLTDLNVHPDLVAKLSRPYAVIKGKLDRQMAAFIGSNIVKPILDLKVMDRRNGTDMFGTFNRVMRGETNLSEEEVSALRNMNLVDQNGLLTPRARSMVNDTTVNPDLRETIQKVVDNETWSNSVALQTLGARARRWMEQEARKNPELVGVRAEWDKPYGPEWFYHKNHPVAKAFGVQRDAYANLAVAQKRLIDAANAHKTLNTDQTLVNFNTAANAVNDAQDAVTIARSDFYREFQAGAPASMYDALAERFRGRAISYAQQAPQRVAKLKEELTAAKARGDTQRVTELQARIKEEGPHMPLEAAIERIRGSVDFKMISDAIGPEATATLRREVEATWRSLAQDGIDPIFLPNVKDSRLEHVRFPTVIPEAPKAKAHASKNTSFNLSRSVNDVSVGLVEIKRQQLTEAGTAEFATKWVSKWAKQESEPITQIQNAIRNGGPTTADIRAQSKAEMDRHYAKWDPESQGFGVWFPSVEGGQWVLPKGVQTALRYLGMSEGNNPFIMKYDSVMKVWRFSILTTPRHLSHVLLGGLMMGQVRDPLFIPHFIKQFSKARGIMQGDNYELLAQFGGNANDFTPEQLYGLGASKSMGRIATAVSKGFRGVNKFEESATMMYKITTMLSKEDKVGREEAINMANKMFVDMNSMLPIERVFLRKLFPFYGYTRHLFRYLMTLPADHPMTAAILTNFANQHLEDDKSGLPQDMSFMFYLGAPDINGNVAAVDYRSMDPFRSFYNMFYLGGFFSQMNPAIQMAVEQMGVNVLSGTPELYPNTHYDPNTGTMVADQPSNPLLRIMESILPETAAIDAKFQLSDQWKNLKVSDPAAFQHRIYTALGIPFGYQTINIPAKEQAAQMKRYRDAQTSIDQAIQTGDFTKAKRYGYVPVPSLMSPYIPGQYATPQQIEAVYRALQDRLGVNVSLHAVLPKPTRRRTA